MESVKKTASQLIFSLILRQIILLTFIFSGFSFSEHFAQAAGPSCKQLFTEQKDFVRRLKIIKQDHHWSLSELLFQFKRDGKLFYRGKHTFEPGTDFLASNEYDWLATPFDHKPSDVLIAFGTNSAWEIAVNKNVKSLYIADWSPYPLLASAYLISPLIKIAKTPHELIVLLSGRIPTAELVNHSLNELFETSRFYVNENRPEKTAETNSFLKYLARQNISDFELQFLTSYFYGLAGKNIGKNNLGPFENLRHASFAKLLNFFDQRYSPSVAAIHNQKLSVDTALESFSVFSSLKNFNKLKFLFDNNRIHYGLTEITDTNFYQMVQQKEKANGYQKYTLSITNIFDCGDYNGLTIFDLQNYLKNTMSIFGATETNPLVVFRTTNIQPPHGFYRYDLTTPMQVQELKPNEALPIAN